MRDSRVEDGRLVLSGVANAMPCTVEIGDKELVRIAGRLLKPAVIGLFFKGLFRKDD